MPLFLAFLSRYWSQILIVTAGAALVLWFHHSAYQDGWNTRDADWKADTAKREEFGRQERERLQMAYDQIAIDQAVMEAQQQRKREVEYREVIKKQTIYRDSPNAGKCSIPDEFVCIVDTSYEGLLPEAADTCRSQLAAGRLSDVELLSFITDAKSRYTACRDEVMEWREREQQIQAVQ